MPLWFEVAVLILLACIAVCGIDVCFALESVNKNIANLGIRLETVIGQRSNSHTTHSG
jgi:hypothetical protein